MRFNQIPDAGNRGCPAVLHLLRALKEVNMMGDSDSNGVPHPGPSSRLGRSTRKVHFPKDVGSGQLWFHSDYLTVNTFI